MATDYPANWPEIADQVKSEAGWKCVRCKAAHSREGWRVLTVHHLDGDKSNCRWWNLAALCQRCHLSIQGRVKMGQQYMHAHSRWFLPYVAGYNAFQLLALELDREQTMERLPELLTVGQPWLADHYYWAGA